MSNAERDPRHDPIPGDVVGPIDIGGDSSIVWYHVHRVEGGTVFFGDGPNHYRGWRANYTISMWRARTAKYEVRAFGNSASGAALVDLLVDLALVDSAPPKPWLWREAPTTPQNMARLLADLDPELILLALRPCVDACSCQFDYDGLRCALNVNIEDNGLKPPEPSHE